MRRPHRLVFLPFLLVLLTCTDTPEPDPLETNPPRSLELIVLGIAQDGGLPHLGCTKPCCSRARMTGRVLFPACIGVHDPSTGAIVLFEATPAVEAQLAVLQQWSRRPVDPRRPVDAIVLTHAHIGHYTGLVHFGREVAGAKQIPVHATKRMGDFLSKNGPWSQLVSLEQIDLKRIEPGEAFEPIPGLSVTAISVPHRDEFSDTVAFKLRGPQRTVLFLPDIDYFTDESLEELLRDVDLAFIDATFYDGSELPGRDLSKIPHPRMVETMKRLGPRVAAGKLQVLFIHLNHTNPALHDEAIQRSMAEKKFRMAEQGELLRF